MEYLTGALTTSLTIGSAARDDGYGDRAEERLRLHLVSMGDFARGVGAPVEHVMVDWNPVAGAPLEERYGRFDVPHLPRRWVSVQGPEVETLTTSAGPPFVVAAGNNAAIQHANTDWLLIVNADVALTFGLGVAVGALMKTLGTVDVFARVDRLDIRYQDGEQLPDRVDLADALGRAVRINRRHGTDSVSAISPSTLGFSPTEIAALASRPRSIDHDLGFGFMCVDRAGPTRGLHTNASGDFILARTETWRRAGGFITDLEVHGHADSLMVAALAAAGAHQVILSFPSVVVHVEHDDLAPSQKYSHFSGVQERFGALISAYCP
jgi:hypothetical protein